MDVAHARTGFTDRFIPAAEASGMIAALGEFVLRAQWPDRPLDPGRARCRLVRHLGQRVGQAAGHGVVTPTVERALRGAGLSPRHLGLEVTETAIVEGGAADSARVDLQRLHDLGMRIAIDDFGTGY